jgi:DNA polymerase-3 subunit beta
MKFTIQRDEIYEAIQKVANVIPQRSTIPITQNILFIAEENQLQLVATDLEITIVSNVHANIEAAGRLAVPGRLIHDIVRELPNTELTFEMASNNRLLLRSSFGEYKVSGESAEEFPKRPHLENVKEIVLPNEALRRLIEKTIFACSTDELRPALTGVFFEIGNKQVRTVATDGHRLGMLTYQDGDLPAEEMSAILSTRALNFVLRNLDSQGLTAINLGERHARFNMDNTELYARLIEESFVNYNRVIPQETNFSLTLNNSDFLASVKRVSLFANPISAKVVLNIHPDHIQIHAEDADCGGEASEEIPCEFTGDQFTIGFNSRYLQSVLRQVDSDEVNIQLIRPDAAVLLEPMTSPEKETQLMLLMPIRLD